MDGSAAAAPVKAESRSPPIIHAAPKLPAACGAGPPSLLPDDPPSGTHEIPTLVAQATAFGPGFRVFALLVLPIVLLVGVATVTRLGDANTDDFGLVIGMNRLRHAYLELAPDLEPYFVTAHHDDETSVMRSYGLGDHRLRFGRVLGGTPNLVAAINVVVVGVLAALIADTLTAPDAADTVVGVVTALAAAAGFGVLAFRTIASGRRAHRLRSPQ